MTGMALKPQGSRLALALAFPALALQAQPALAFESIKFDDGTTLEMSLHMSYQNLKRVNGVDPIYNDMRVTNLTTLMKKTAWLNSDDGDNSVGKHGTISNRVSGLLEANLTHDNYRAFVRANAFYDTAFDHDSNNASQGTFNGIGPSNQYSDSAKNLLGRRARLLDSYVQGRWKFGADKDKAVTLKVGRQVVNWGEGLLFMGIGGSMNPMDMVKGLTPGVPIQELFLPTEQAYAKIELSENLTLLGYKKWRFRETEVAPVGTYFSPNDQVGPGASYLSALSAVNPMLASFGLGGVARVIGDYGAPRTEDVGRTAKGQWGLGAKYQLTNETGLGVYHLRYNEVTPLPEFGFGTSPWKLGKGYAAANDPLAGILAWTNLLPSSYHIRYMDDIKLTGASITTRLGELNVAGEFAYRDGAPLLMADQHYNLARGKVTNAQISAIKLWGPEFMFGLLKADQARLAAEIAVSHVNSYTTPPASGQPGTYPALIRAFLPPGSVSTSGQPALMYDKTTAAYALNGEFSYNNLFPGWDMAVPVMLMQQLRGNPAIQGWNFGLGGKNDRHASLGLKFTYQQNLELGLQYAWYAGNLDVGTVPFNHSSTSASWADRDFIAFTAAYHL